MLRQAAIDLICNLWAGCRLALFRPLADRAFRPSVWQVAMLFLLSLVMEYGYNLLALWPDAVFSFAGLHYQGTVYLLFFSSVVLIAAVAGTAGAATVLATMMLAVAPFLFVVYSCAYWALPRLPWPAPLAAWQGLTAAYVFWYLAVATRALMLVLRPRLRALAAYLAVFALLNIAVPLGVLPAAPLWEPTQPEPDTTAEHTGPDIEQLFFRQDELMARAVGALLAQRDGAIDVYFVGVAGYAPEDVFMNETRLATALFENRFGSAGRSLMLINNAQTFDRVPLASRENLAEALEGVARRVDPREDLVVLFITSHGEEDAGLLMDTGNYAMARITPRGLRAALDGAGLRNRVIIISACFSGAFVEELRNPDSLIIAASRSDRSSFGCGHDGPYTYFGQAFFGEGLAREYSLAAAFELARASLSERERREDRTPSEPQIWIGANIERLLERLVTELGQYAALAPDTGSPERVNP